MGLLGSAGNSHKRHRRHKRDLDFVLWSLPEEDDTKKPVCLSGTADESVFRDAAGFGKTCCTGGTAGCANLLRLWMRSVLGVR
jgi:hypothetical protein